MNFGLTEEQELLRKTARDFLSEHAAMARVREVMEGPDGYAADLWRRIAELGWIGLALPERFGGADLSMVELAIVIEELGRTLAPVPFLPTSIAARAILEAGSEAQQNEWLPRIASGDAIATLAITEAVGSEAPEDLSLVAARSGDGYALSGRKLFVPDADSADLFVVVGRTGGEGENGLSLFLVPSGTPGVSRTPLSSMDLLRGLHELHFDDAKLPATALLGTPGEGWPGILRILDEARVMICAEMVGGAERCLEASVAYAKERVQFGKPIGVNQAIKHKCADMLFAVEGARSITYYAAWAARERNAEAPLAAAMAKAHVSDAYRKVAGENIQIHGGVGFTWEYDCHLYYKRAKSDEVWLGDAMQQRAQVARLLDV